MCLIIVYLVIQVKFMNHEKVIGFSQHLQLIYMSREFQALNNYALLPRGYEIKNFLHKFLQDDEYDLVEQCYYIHNSLKEAQMMIIVCLGGPDIVDQIQKKFDSNQEISEYKIERLRSIVNKFMWKNNSNSTKIFMENSQVYKSYHQQLVKQIYPDFNSNKVSSLYKSTCKSSDYLFGTRIREFIKKSYIERANRRTKQRQEEQNLIGNNYLIIHQKEPNYVITGVFRTHKHYYTQSESPQSQKKPQRSTPRKSLEISQASQPSKNDNTNNSNYCCCCIIF